MRAADIEIGTAGERLLLDTYGDGATVVQLVEADGRPTFGARVIPAGLDVMAEAVTQRALAVRDPIAGAGDSPRGEDLDRALRWCLERLMAASAGIRASDVLVEVRADLGIGLEAFWLSDRGRR